MAKNDKLKDNKMNLLIPAQLLILRTYSNLLLQRLTYETTIFFSGINC
jgi:hypothetical protein